jgi:L-seryl-tRNA(Ser) seleniumtransferase
LRRVLNATGVLVHTNLGRAPLASGALAAMQAAGASYTNLEYDLEAGERGSRGAHLQTAASALFPGRALLAVNNNAAAVLLALNTLAEGREVILSRGEMVEIGGSFRIPEVMAKAGAHLKEVGTTNRTRLADYSAAVSERTALIVKVHTSNYRIVGFVEETTVAELAELAAEKGLPLLVDQGSGTLLKEGPAALPGETDVASLLGMGASLVACSGDKVLGGPQAGLLVGEPELVSRCARNPLARALRLDKNRIAALAWTLAEYAAGRAQESVPVLAMLRRTPAEIGTRARRIADALAASGVEAIVEEGTSRVGGGAAPLHDLPTQLLVLAPKGKSVAACEAALRRHDPPVIARIAGGRLLVDLRTVDPAEDDLLASALTAAAK